MNFDIFLNAKLGDGCLSVQTHKNIVMCTARFTGTIKSWQHCKLKVAQQSGYALMSNLNQKEQAKEAYGTKPIYHFSFTAKEQVLYYTNLTIKECISKLSIYDLVAWYLDDGSYHKSRETMHLYSNSLSKEENLYLIEHIYTLLNEKPRLRLDRKKNGKEYYYLYFGRKLIINFFPYVKSFLDYHQLTCDLGYKIGNRVEPPEIRKPGLCK